MTAFNSAFNSAFGHQPQGPIIIDPSAGQGAIATQPYADVTEHVPFREYATEPLVHPPFHPTDARAVEIFLEPNHYNLITNPSLRQGRGSWSFNGFVDGSDSWIGNCMNIQGEDQVTHDAIYVGPFVDRSAADPGWIEPKRAGPEYTFSLYAKGVDSRLQLVLYGYRPKDISDPSQGMEDDPSSEILSPWYTVSSEDWERHYVKTTYRLGDISGGTSDFTGCWWIVPVVNIIEEDMFDEDPPWVKLSSFMLDPTEGKVCDYFDGDMVEPDQDDFIWIYDSPPGTPNREQRFSAYYYERQARCQWMHKHMYEAVPVNRPVHVYYYDRNNPWDGNGPIPNEITSEEHTRSSDGPSLLETSVSQYAGLARALP